MFQAIEKVARLALAVGVRDDFIPDLRQSYRDRYLKLSVSYMHLLRAYYVADVSLDKEEVRSSTRSTVVVYCRLY